MGTVVILLLCSTAPALAQANGNHDFSVQELLRTTLQSIQALGTEGIVLFVVLYAIATIAFVPGSLLTLGAGVVYGVVQGSLYVLLGATLGAIAAFLIGRYLVRQWVAQRLAARPQFKAIDAAIGQQGLKIVLLTRLSPIFPFNLLNYALGITSVSFRDYCLGFLGMIPGTVMYVYLGSLAGSLATLGTAQQPTDATAQWLIRILGFIATVAVTLYITRIARKALAEAAPGVQASSD